MQTLVGRVLILLFLEQYGETLLSLKETMGQRPEEPLRGDVLPEPGEFVICP